MVQNLATAILIARIRLCPRGRIFSNPSTSNNNSSDRDEEEEVKTQTPMEMTLARKRICLDFKRTLG